MKDKNIFSLVELLLVIAVIAILIAILLPAVSKAYSISKRANCANNQKQFIYALYLYADDYNELLPATASVIKNCYKNYRLHHKYLFVQEMILIKTMILIMAS